MENTKTNGVYKIVNTINGRFYIGSGEWAGRLKKHLYLLRKGEGRNWKLQEDYDIFGEEAFEFTLIQDLGEIDPRPMEDMLIKTNWDSGLLYNIYNSAYGPTPETITDETRQKMSLAKMGIRHSADHRKNIAKGMKGKTNAAKLSIDDVKQILLDLRHYRCFKQFSRQGDMFKHIASQHNVSESTIKNIDNGTHSLSKKLKDDFEGGVAI